MQFEIKWKTNGTKFFVYFIWNAIESQMRSNWVCILFRMQLRVKWEAIECIFHFENNWD
jgi:hypothetical protein